MASPETRAAPPPKAGPIAVGVIVVVALSAFFYAFPEIDLWASRAFYVPGHGFFLAADRGLATFRSSADVLVAVAAGILL